MINKIYRRIKCNLRCFGEWLDALKEARRAIKLYMRYRDEVDDEEDYAGFWADCLHRDIQEMFDSGFIKLTIGFITWYEDAIKEAMDYRDSLKTTG